MELTEREGIFTGGSGIKLHYRSHRAQAASFQAVIALVESPEDRGRLYADLVQRLAPTGYVLYGCALHDHRRQPGQAGFLEEWNEFYRELDSFVGMVRELEPDAPVFLAGRHVSGQLVLSYALHHPEGLSGVIAHAPSLHMPGARSPLVSLTRALSRIWPAFPPTAEAAPELDQNPATRRVDRSSLPSAVHRSGEAAPMDVITSDISIPVLIIDAESSPDAETDIQDSAGERPDPHSLTDLESWLVRVLSAGSA
jgi:alpha-beta hydrolase superfamily lysophospholipase